MYKTKYTIYTNRRKCRDSAIFSLFYAILGVILNKKRLARARTRICVYVSAGGRVNTKKGGFMTSYKRYLKKIKEMPFDEDLPFLPYNVDSAITLETRDVFPTPQGLLVVSIYNVGVGRAFYLRSGKRLDIYDEDEYTEMSDIYDLPEIRPCEIRIYHDLPHYMFLFDDNDVLIAVRHTNRNFE